MSSLHGSETREEPLNDSWVELNFQQQSRPASGTVTPSMAKPTPIHVYSGQMEKLLMEAQRESSRSSSEKNSVVSSRGSSRGSPKSPHSPNNEWAADGTHPQAPPSIQTSDWIWDWSSRPESMPPSGYERGFKHPRRSRLLSVRNTRMMRNGPFSLENLPALLVTHACTFFMGAAVMFIYLKKYCSWAATTPANID